MRDISKAVVLVVCLLSLVASSRAAACNGTQADILIILDSSASVCCGTNCNGNPPTSCANYDLMKDYVVEIITSFSAGVDSGDVHLGVMVYSGQNHCINYSNGTQTCNIKCCQDEWLLSTNMTSADMVAAARVLPYYGQATYTAHALQHAHGISMTAGNGNRGVVPNTVFTVTDGVANDHTQVQSSASALQLLATTYSIGVGGYNMTELNWMASPTKGGSRVATALTYSDLQYAIEPVVEDSCKTLGGVYINETLDVPGEECVVAAAGAAWYEEYWPALAGAGGLALAAGLAGIIAKCCLKAAAARKKVGLDEEEEIESILKPESSSPNSSGSSSSSAANSSPKPAAPAKAAPVAAAAAAAPVSAAAATSAPAAAAEPPMPGVPDEPMAPAKPARGNGARFRALASGPRAVPGAPNAGANQGPSGLGPNETASTAASNAGSPNTSPNGSDPGPPNFESDKLSTSGSADSGMGSTDGGDHPFAPSPSPADPFRSLSSAPDRSMAVTPSDIRFSPESLDSPTAPPSFNPSTLDNSSSTPDMFSSRSVKPSPFWPMKPPEPRVFKGKKKAEKPWGIWMPHNNDVRGNHNTSTR